MPIALCIVPCLDADVGRVVKGVDFENLRDVGDPVELTSRYGTEGTDGITFLDVSASSQGRVTMFDVAARTAKEAFVPLMVGSGVRSVGDVARLLAHDTDKVGINTAAIADPDPVSRIADRFGDQVLVLSADTRRCPGSITTASSFKVTTHGDKRSIDIDAPEQTLKAASLDVGEILLNSMDTDGVHTGFDLETPDVFRPEVTVSPITSGGVGTSEHSLEAARTDANALLTVSVFHFGEVAVSDVKSALHTQGLEVCI